MIKIYFIVASLFLISMSALGQSPLPEPQDVRVKYIPSSDILVDSTVADTLIDAFDLVDDNFLMNLEVSVLTSDTLQLNRIHLKIGRSSGVWDVFSSFFEFDQVPAQTGLTYQRINDEIIMGVGSHSNVDDLYYEILFEDVNGDSTAVVSGSTL